MFINYIDLTDEEFKEYKDIENNIIKLNKMNIFIGQNNSGKSRLMRKVLISHINDIIYEGKLELLSDVKNTSEWLLSQLEDSNLMRKEYSKVWANINNHDTIRTNKEEVSLAKYVVGINKQIFGPSELAGILESKRILPNSWNTHCSDEYKVFSRFRGRDFQNGIRRLAGQYTEFLKNSEEKKCKTLFFPSILSLKKLDNLSSDVTSKYHTKLSNIVKSEYFNTIDNMGTDSIKTGQEVYQDMRKMLLGLKVERDYFSEYEKYISENFFDGKDVSIFINEKDANIYIKIDEEEPYPIYNLGDGLQTLIVITFYLFMYKNENLKIFIDEPEIHLHPGLQRLLICKLLEFDNCQFFITTHSSAIIDICDEFQEKVSIICVEKNGVEKTAYNIEYKDIDVFNLIGTRPSSLILSNCTIWTEGPTDPNYINTFLRIYQEKMNKKKYVLGYNYNYAFNGSINIASKFDIYSDNEVLKMKLNRFSKENFMIFDSDNLTEENANYKKIQRIKEQMIDKCYVVKSIKTIENIIPSNILREFFSKLSIKSSSKHKLILDYFDNEFNRKNTDKIDIADNMAEYMHARNKHYNIKTLYKYCNNLWSQNKNELSLFFEEKVSNMSLEEKIQLYDNANEEFKKMIEKIYQFIEKANN